VCPRQSLQVMIPLSTRAVSVSILQSKHCQMQSQTRIDRGKITRVLYTPCESVVVDDVCVEEGEESFFSLCCRRRSRLVVARASSF
jgi:hypothetical protein